MSAPTEADKIAMALDRLALLERAVAVDAVDARGIREFCANMRLRLEHGRPGDTIACFARE